MFVCSLQQMQHFAFFFVFHWCQCPRSPCLGNTGMLPTKPIFELLPLQLLGRFCCAEEQPWFFHHHSPGCKVLLLVVSPSMTCCWVLLTAPTIIFCFHWNKRVCCCSHCTRKSGGCMKKRSTLAQFNVLWRINLFSRLPDQATAKQQKGPKSWRLFLCIFVQNSCMSPCLICLLSAGKDHRSPQSLLFVPPVLLLFWPFLVCKN